MIQGFLFPELDEGAPTEEQLGAALLRAAERAAYRYHKQAGLRDRDEKDAFASDIVDRALTPHNGRIARGRRWRKGGTTSLDAYLYLLCCNIAIDLIRERANAIAVHVDGEPPRRRVPKRSFERFDALDDPKRVEGIEAWDFQ